ncbi:hypothetical protein K4H03_23950, partial [Mycobacterium tuberculosis]|nr:hypothetical protein [Mycobacterium tuberculosis]
QERAAHAPPPVRVDGFRFETDELGVIRWVEGVSRAPLIGLSLGGFGNLHALAQACVTGRATKRFGEKQAIIAGMAADALGYVLLAFGWH